MNIIEFPREDPASKPLTLGERVRLFFQRQRAARGATDWRYSSSDQKMRRVLADGRYQYRDATKEETLDEAENRAW